MRRGAAISPAASSRSSTSSLPAARTERLHQPHSSTHILTLSKEEQHVPKILLVACAAFAGAFLTKAGLAPFYEVGLPRFTTPLIACSMAVLVMAFMVRKRWSWPCIMAMTVVFPVIGFAYPPDPEAFGAWTSAVRAVDLIEGVAGLVILGFLARSRTKRWFFADPLFAPHD